jgi:hypothetical protein
MEWKVEECKENGITWIEDEYARTICDFYYKNEQGGGLEENFYIFDNAKTNAQLIAKAPQQEALIEELCEALSLALGMYELHTSNHPDDALANEHKDRIRKTFLKAENR